MLLQISVAWADGRNQIWLAHSLWGRLTVYGLSFITLESTVYSQSLKDNLSSWQGSFFGKRKRNSRQPCWICCSTQGRSTTEEPTRPQNWIWKIFSLKVLIWLRESMRNGASLFQISLIGLRWPRWFFSDCWSSCFCYFLFLFFPLLVLFSLYAYHIPGLYALINSVFVWVWYACLFVCVCMSLLIKENVKQMLWELIKENIKQMLWEYQE